ncbi:MAG: helix-turn-helix domain-containing protein [Cyanobacteriota bacterium]|nr:helix-turn-helix domain-containing protein [Cyanobacteriota bacterium]
MEISAASSFAIAGHPTIETGTHSKRSLYTNIETELQSSEVYQKVLANLKTMLGDAGAKADGFLAAVGREAIQLALKKFAKKYRSELQAVAQTNMSSESNNPEKAEGTDNSQTKAKDDATTADKAEPEQSAPLPSADVEALSKARDGEKAPETETELDSTDNNSNTVESSSSSSEEKKEKVEEVKKGSSGGSPKKNQKKKKKKLTKAEKAALEKASKRKEILQEIGQELRKARVARCLSLKQVHAQTLVPLNHLDAIEKGNVEKLPEDIYVRGFIYRLADALGLDGRAMVARLPDSDPLQGMTPSWSGVGKSSGPGFELRPLHLYVGYTALMAGAVGGLTAVTQHSNPGAQFVPEVPDGTTEAIARSDRGTEVTATPGLRSTARGIVVGSDIAPPEMMN